MWEIFFDIRVDNLKHQQHRLPVLFARPLHCTLDMDKLDDDEDTLDIGGVGIGLSPEGCGFEVDD
jgi:hypothetical protein